MTQILPTLGWYTGISTSKGLSPRCPFASTRRCPRYYLSVSMMGGVGATKIPADEEKRLRERWQSSDLWPATDEQAPWVFGNDEKHFHNFCPEVSYDMFKLFASGLDPYVGESDRDAARERLTLERVAHDDPRWEWAEVRAMHYTECPTYSPLTHGAGQRVEGAAVTDVAEIANLIERLHAELNNQVGPTMLARAKLGDGIGASERFATWRERAAETLDDYGLTDFAQRLRRGVAGVRGEPVRNAQLSVDAASELLASAVSDLTHHADHWKRKLARAARGSAQAVPMEAVARPVAQPGAIFVVHGRDARLRNSMFAFLRSLRLDPLEWSDAIRLTGSAAPFVGQVLDTAFNHAQAVVVLLTPDDEARLQERFREEHDPPHETTLTPQARPNVLFEAGMALARHPDRTLLVEIGTLRPFSDVAGRHAIHLSNTPESRLEVAERLRTAGCPVVTTGQDWLSTGDFSPTPL